ncbi:hypothetical protein Tco_0360280 [Tanacetum coccineum]
MTMFILAASVAMTFSFLKESDPPSNLATGAMSARAQNQLPASLRENFASNHQLFQHQNHSVWVEVVDEKYLLRCEAPETGLNRRQASANVAYDFSLLETVSVRKMRIVRAASISVRSRFSEHACSVVRGRGLRLSLTINSQSLEEFHPLTKKFTIPNLRSDVEYGETSVCVSAFSVRNSDDSTADCTYTKTSLKRLLMPEGFRLVNIKKIPEILWNCLYRSLSTVAMIFVRGYFLNNEKMPSVCAASSEVAIKNRSGRFTEVTCFFLSTHLAVSQKL